MKKQNDEGRWRLCSYNHFHSCRTMTYTDPFCKTECSREMNQQINHSLNERTNSYSYSPRTNSGFKAAVQFKNKLQSWSALSCTLMPCDCNMLKFPALSGHQPCQSRCHNCCHSGLSRGVCFPHLGKLPSILKQEDRQSVAKLRPAFIICFHDILHFHRITELKHKRCAGPEGVSLLGIWCNRPTDLHTKQFPMDSCTNWTFQLKLRSISILWCPIRGQISSFRRKNGLKALVFLLTAATSSAIPHKAGRRFFGPDTRPAPTPQSTLEINQMTSWNRQNEQWPKKRQKKCGQMLTKINCVLLVIYFKLSYLWNWSKTSPSGPWWPARLWSPGVLQPSPRIQRGRRAESPRRGRWSSEPTSPWGKTWPTTVTSRSWELKGWAFLSMGNTKVSYDVSRKMIKWYELIWYFRMKKLVVGYPCNQLARAEVAFVSCGARCLTKRWILQRRDLYRCVSISKNNVPSFLDVLGTRCCPYANPITPTRQTIQNGTAFKQQEGYVINRVWAPSSKVLDWIWTEQE